MLIASNAIAIAYFGVVHQRAPVAVMEHLSRRLADGDARATPIESVHFLTECHATPAYSHLHRAIALRMLDCSPQFDGAGRLVGDLSRTESGRFAAAPRAFVDALYATRDIAIPSHIVVFDEHIGALRPFLERHRFAVERRFFYSHFAASKYMWLYARRARDTPIHIE